MDASKHLIIAVLAAIELKVLSFKLLELIYFWFAVFRWHTFYSQLNNFLGHLWFFSSPEPLGSKGELIVYPYSGARCRRRQQCLNIFSSETTLPIKAKFYVESPWEGGTKVYINGPGHVTKMAAMPIYGKNL